MDLMNGSLRLLFWGMFLFRKTKGFASVSLASASLSRQRGASASYFGLVRAAAPALTALGGQRVDVNRVVREIQKQSRMAPILTDDPSDVEIEDSAFFFQLRQEESMSSTLSNSGYPFALMMQGSAPYIAAHAGETAVFHISGELFDTKHIDSVISDIALARLLGMKIVLVVGCRYDSDSCSLDFEHPIQCRNALKVTTPKDLRHLEEEAGFLRTEVERKLNRCIRMHGGVSVHGIGGYVVSGNFFTAQKFGLVQGQDFENSGFALSVHSTHIHKILNNNDIVLLTTVGMTSMGELVNVNGYHLAASVAGALDAYKLVYFANQGSVLCEKDENGQRKPIQEVPLSFARAITDHFGVSVYGAGFATFRRNALSDGGHTHHTTDGGIDYRHAARATELLLHLGWASWALERGVTRAHVVNPTDGALLEELFTSKNGANTCLYHDSENNEQERDDLEAVSGEWDKFFQAASMQNIGQHAADKFG